MEKHKVFSFVNIIGLSVSMAVCLVITNYILFEKSYDLFHENNADIYRVSYSRFIDGEFQYSKAQVYPAVGEKLKESIPEVKEYTRIFDVTSQNEAVLSINVEESQNIFTESSIYAVDSSFLKIFTTPLTSGDPETALYNPNGFLLSESIAKKFFGDEDPIGKTIHWKDMGEWQVTGVFPDLPENSHMKFDILTSWMPPYGERSLWNWDGFYTYILLASGSDYSKIETMIQSVLDESTSKRHDPTRIKSTFFLQPLKHIHLHSHLNGEMRINGNHKMIITLQVIALTILILAVINYFNLSLARSIKRTKEVGVRKVIGSTRTQLAGLFFTESLLFNFFALILSITLFTLSQHYFSNLVGKPIGSLIWKSPLQTGAYIGLMIIFIAVLTAIYSTRLVVANPFGSAGKIRNYSMSSSVRKTLLTFQFMTTIIMVVGTLLIQKQTSFMLDQSPGFDLNQNLVVKTFAGPFAERDSTIINKLRLFKEKVKTYSTVKNVSISSNIPGIENSWVGRLRKSETDDDLITASRTRVDIDYIDTYNLELIAGKNFSSENPDQVILNHSAIKVFGYNSPEDALGIKLMGDHEIIGVINDYHEQSLQYPVIPTMLTTGQGYLKYITINVNPGNFNHVVKEIQEVWSTIFPELPFDYFFLDQFFNMQYQQEQRLTKIFAYFSGIGIFISCLGLFGFTYYVAHQRIKEIGIRKTLGASVFNLLKLLSLESVRLVLIAGTVALPLSYYLSIEWLSSYAIKIEPGIQLYLLSIILIGSLAFLSTLFLILKVIKINPAESLRYE